MKQRLFTLEHINWLRKNAAGKPYRELAGIFNKVFHTNFTRDQIKSRCRDLKISNGLSTSPGASRIIPMYAETTWGDNKVRVKTPTGWQHKHHYIWEQTYGKIPKGYRVIFLDKNRKNYKLDNLELVLHTEAVILAYLDLWSTDKDLTLLGLAIVRYNIAFNKALSKNLGEVEARRLRKCLLERHGKQRRKLAAMDEGGNG